MRAEGGFLTKPISQAVNLEGSIDMFSQPTRSAQSKQVAKGVPMKRGSGDGGVTSLRDLEMQKPQTPTPD